MPRIALAEDDQSMVRLLSTLLRMDGFEVESVGEQEDIAAAVELSLPDLLLLDMRLAQRSGIEVLDTLRRSDAARNLRIVMISGLNVREECLRHGADDFLLKPFMPEELIETLHRNLQAPE